MVAGVQARDTRPGTAVGLERNRGARCKSKRSHGPLWLPHVVVKGSWQDPDGEPAQPEEGVQRERKEDGGDEYVLSTLARPWVKQCSFNPANTSPRWVLESPQTGR